MIKRIQNASILTRLLFWFLVIGLLPLGIVMLITLNSSQNLIQTEVQSRLRAISDGKISQIETYAQERARDVFALTRIPTIIDGITDFTTTLTTAGVDSDEYATIDENVRFLLTHILDGSGYENLMLFSSEGNLLFSVLPADDIGQRYTDLYPNSALVQTLENARTLLQTEISASTDNNQNPVFYISAPVFSDDLVIGIVSIQLDSQDLYAAISDNTGLGLSETGETMAIFREGDDVVFSLPTVDDTTSFTRISSLDDERSRPLLEAVAGIQGAGIIPDYAGQEVIAVWSYLPSLRWGMMVKINTSEAFGAVRVQQNFVLGLMIATLVGLVGISYTLANSVSRPIKNLVTATKSVAQGVYENKIVAKGSGEIAQLVDAFDLLIKNTIRQRTMELERVAEQERENTRMRDEFFAVMSHELRTPLNAIIGFVGIIQMNETLDEKTAHRLDRVMVNAERLLGLINDILDVSRIESGRVQVFKREVVIRTFFNDLHAQMQSLAEQKSLTFSVSIADDIPQSLFTDEELITKIFVNLIGNALKFTETGGVTVSVTRDGDMWITVVKDTGIGIPAHMHELIFERFRQVDSSATRRYSGTGLGLSIVNSLVKTLDGKLRLESALNEGASFFVTLPLETTPEKALADITEGSQQHGHE
ncbi:MAG: sensor histidine kinase [bacterium]|nr:sensor histidine kinase [bacterium]